LAQLLNH